MYLCEKPSQAKDIARVLGAGSKRDGYLEGDGVRVTWCLGHLLEMVKPDGYGPHWKVWRLESLPILPEQWRLDVREAVGKQFNVIKGLLQTTQEVVIATDADREGETIGREVLVACGYRGGISRLWLSALDDVSIRKALNAILPGERTEPLYRAGLGRSRADWLVGMNLTRAYTILGQRGGYNGVLTVGRVQTPTLKLVVDRDRLIENFKPVAYFELMVNLEVREGTFRAKWVPSEAEADLEGRCLDKQRAEAVAHKVMGQSGIIQKAETKRMLDAPPLPLELSTLQQEASRRWSMGAGQTLEVAQALYEKYKAITYPRTDSRHLPVSQLAEVPQVLASMVKSDASLTDLVAQADLSLRSKAWDDAKVKAHHAMIPTQAVVSVAGMSMDERRVYDLIRRHYLAQFFPAYAYDRTVVDVVVEAELFRASGNVEVAPGWKQVLRSEAAPKQEEPPRLPASMRRNDPVRVVETSVEEKQTKPPNRFTEGTLIQAMKNVGRMVEDPRFKQILRETSGIGTEATRAAIIENLLQRNLLVREGKSSLVSTPVGRVLVDMLPQSVTNPATTAVWEQALEDIANDTRTLEEFQDKAVVWVSRLIAAVKNNSEMRVYDFSGVRTERESVSGQTSGACPLCQTGTLVERTAKTGQNAGNRFLGCSRYPQCRFARSV
ncbi:MAG: DNA topoisomerase III [Magnetococcus sp. YQC-5]